MSAYVPTRRKKRVGHTTPVTAIIAPRVSAVEISPWYLVPTSAYALKMSQAVGVHWNNDRKNACTNTRNDSPDQN